MSHRPIDGARICIEAYIHDNHSDYLFAACRLVDVAVESDKYESVLSSSFSDATRRLHELSCTAITEPLGECFRLLSVIELELMKR